MSAVHPPPIPSPTISGASSPTEGTGFPLTFVRTEAMRLLQREQEQAVALLETSPLLSYLFFTYAASAKTTADPPAPHNSEELSSLKLLSEKLESELGTAQAALAEARTMIESLREEVRRVKADMIEDRSRHAATLEEKEGEKEDLRREAQKYRSEGEALQKLMANRQLEVARTRQQSIAEKAALQTRFDELQRQFDDLSRKREEESIPVISPFGGSPTGRPQSPEQPTTPLRRPRHATQSLTLTEQSTVRQAGSSTEVTPLEPPTPQTTALLGDPRSPNQPSPTPGPSKSQKLKAKRAAKKRAQQEAEATHQAQSEVLVETS